MNNNITINAMIKIIILSSSIVFLSACGSDGNETSTTVTSSDFGNHASTTETALFKTADLVASKDFSFSPAKKIDLSVDVSNKTTSSSRLSICKDYKITADGAYKVDYNSCIVNTALVDGKYQKAIKITNDIKKLISVIWFMDDIKNPQFNELDVSMNEPISIF